MYKRQAIKNKAELPFIRPAKLAKNNSPEIDTWKHAVKFLNKNKDIQLIVSIPTTSPLRKAVSYTHLTLPTILLV